VVIRDVVHDPLEAEMSCDRIGMGSSPEKGERVADGPESKLIAEESVAAS